MASKPKAKGGDPHARGEKKSSARPSSAKDAVGWRVKVFWETDKLHYYGEVTKYLGGKNIKIVYDDDDSENCAWTDSTITWLEKLTVSTRKVQTAVTTAVKEGGFMGSVIVDLLAKGIDPGTVLAKASAPAPPPHRRAVSDSSTLDDSGIETSEDDTEEDDSDEDDSDEENSDEEDSDEDDSDEDDSDEDESQDDTEDDVVDDDVVAGTSKSKSRSKVTKVYVKYFYCPGTPQEQIRKATLKLKQRYKSLIRKLSKDFECPGIVVQYHDEDHDLVTVKSQEGLRMAFKFYKRAVKSGTGGTDGHHASLRLLLFPPDSSLSSGLDRPFTVAGLGGDVGTMSTLPGISESGVLPSAADIAGLQRAESVGGLAGLKRAETADALFSPREGGSVEAKTKFREDALARFAKTEGDVLKGLSRSEASAERPVTTAGPAGTTSIFSGPKMIADTGGLTSFQKGQLIGRGSYGKVYVALDLVTGLEFAVKQVKMGPDGKSRREVEALKREIDLLDGLRHPHIVKYLGTQIDGNKLYIFLELASNGSVSKALSKFGTFSEAIIRRYTAQVLSGLAYLHSKGIIHRDVKGSNILLDRGIARLADFGCSKQVSESSDIPSEALHTAVGTTQYMAPEVMKDSTTGYGPKADVWSLGMTVLEMATGSPPWTNPGHAVYKICMTEDLPPIPDSLSAEAHSFLELCFKRNLAERPDATTLLSHPFLKDPVSAGNPDLFRPQTRAATSGGGGGGSGLGTSGSSGPSSKVPEEGSEEKDGPAVGMAEHGSFFSGGEFATLPSAATATWLKEGGIIPINPDAPDEGKADSSTSKLADDTAADPVDTDDDSLVSKELESPLREMATQPPRERGAASKELFMSAI